jgi:ribosomal protein S18 acetylase RimI-like enzyme
MSVSFRSAHVQDEFAPALLYSSAASFYDRFAGDAERAQDLLVRLFPEPDHTASVQVCRVATRDSAVVGAVAAFPAADGDRLARRFLALSVPRIPPWQWPSVARQLHAARRLTPPVPRDAWYIDALAVAPEARRRGVARGLLADAEACARAAGATLLALDTTLENAAARALYESEGFEAGVVRRADSERARRLLGVSGFVAYRKRL